MSETTPFNPDKIKKVIDVIKERNNIEGFTQKDLSLYIIHRLDQVQGSVSTNAKAIAGNIENIGWIKKCVFGLYGIIGGLGVSLIIWFLGWI